jgi:putative solute:sodium symporter small subunit
LSTERRLPRRLGLSLVALVAFGAVFGVLPITLFLLPHLHRASLLGIPVALWLVVLPASSVFIVIGWLYARRADALERCLPRRGG